MDIEDEIHERVCSIKFDYLDEKEARDIAILINKARSAPTMSTARWYLAWADSHVYKACMKVDEIFLLIGIKQDRREYNRIADPPIKN